MTARTSTKWAKLIGESAAHVQDGIDWAVDMGFKTLKKVGNTKDKKNGSNENKCTSTAKTLGRGFVRFLGVMGDEYYRTYERLKKKK